MKSLFKILSGIAASLLLTAGLHAAAGKIDPVSQSDGIKKPDRSTTDQGKVSGLPCASCIGDN